MQSGRDPTRRNRNIGTTKQGFGQNNRLTIPNVWGEGRAFFQRFTNPVVVDRTIWSRPFRFIVEPVARRCIHACTIDDIVQLLELMPGEDSRGFSLCVLRQPTRKQEILRPCWGRLLYWDDGDVDRGPTIFLEAQNPSRVLRWSTSLDPDEAIELERLQSDGHAIVQTKREWLISSTIESIRATQLYRTIPHEMGHYVQYRCQPEFPKSHVERERFAHQYADGIRKKLLKHQRIPFARQVGKLQTGFDGLPKEWFGL